jgi:hypothetical protein
MGKGEALMKMTRQFGRIGVVLCICSVAVLAGALFSARRVQADGNDGEEAKIRRGFAIAPVPLNLAHKNRALVGLGSYIVNAQGECNGCHSAGPQSQFLPGGNPYFGQEEKTNPATYLGGGRSFGQFPAAGVPGAVEIISRILGATPSRNFAKPSGRAWIPISFIHIFPLHSTAGCSR